MSEDKEFPTLAVLSATSGVMLTRHIGELYEVLNHVLGMSLMTHQLPNASRVAEPYILSQHPHLREASHKVKSLVPPKDENFEERMTFLCDILKGLYGESVMLSPDREARERWDVLYGQDFFSTFRG